MMHDLEKSDPVIVATKLTNKVGKPTAEWVEPRTGAKGNTAQSRTRRTQSRLRVSPGLDRVRNVARQQKKARFTALLHHCTIDLLRDVFMALKRDAAAGVDGVTWRDYEADLENSLRSLHERIHRGTYRAQPVRRCFILKADGKQRPLGITTLEDKIAQRAVASILNAIYEEDFLGFSYGFRPGRNQHDALDALATGIQAERVNWILDSDIRSYFDRINKSWLIRFLEHRIGDKRIIRLLRKWLKAGVLEEGIWSISETGVSQGATISPLLSNIFLHYVFDLWAVQWRRREASGKMIVLRFADDCVAGFEREADAKRFRDAMRARLEQFALELHTDKTRLLEFGRFAASNRKRRGMGKPETFTFLGFIFICGKSRRGAFQLQRKSCGDRMRATLQEIKAKLRRCMHVPIPVQGKWLRSVVQGYYAYHAVPTNSRAIGAFRYHVMGIWRRVLQRRSQKSNITWERMTKIAAAWLPLPKILHPWPDLRFYVKHPRWEPSARIALAGICAGGA